MDTEYQAPADPYSLQLADVDPSDPELYQRQYHWDYFRRLRNEDPVHFVEGGEFGTLLVYHQV